MTKLWRAANNDYYKNRAERYARTHNIDEENIIDLGTGTWVIIDDRNPGDVRYSIFRKAKPSIIGLTTCSCNDDVNLSQSQFIDIDNVKGVEVMDAPIAGGGVAKGLIIAGGKSYRSIIRATDKAIQGLVAWRKVITFAVNDKDILVKGYHLHFDRIVPNLELGLIPNADNGIELVQVGKAVVGTASDLDKAYDAFRGAMATTKFRSELLVRLKDTKLYIEKNYMFGSTKEQAIKVARELKNLIKILDKSFK